MNEAGPELFTDYDGIYKTDKTTIQVDDIRKRTLVPIGGRKETDISRKLERHTCDIGTSGPLIAHP